MSRSIALFITHFVLSSLLTITCSESQQQQQEQEHGGNVGASQIHNRGYDSSDLVIRLQEYPNYSMRLELGATSDRTNSDRNVTVTFVPPVDHGILIIVQYPKDSYESQSKSFQQAYRYLTPETRNAINNGETPCLNYLTILNLTATVSADDAPVLIQSCAYLFTSYDQHYIRNYFKGVQYYANEANQEVTLVRNPIANPNEGHSLKPSLIVTSYVVCSNFMEATRRKLYKECTPVSTPLHQQQQQPDDDATASAFCIQAKLFCDGNQNCIHGEDRNGTETVIVGVDETKCKTTSSAIAFAPLFPTRDSTVHEIHDPTTTITPYVSDGTTRKPTTKRPWWKPIIPPWSFSSGSETTTKPPPPTTPNVILETIDGSRNRITFGEESVRTPWYSPASPFGTVIIFAAVVILVFGVCSFLAKVHSTRPVYAHNRDSHCESPSSDRPFSAESNSFARQLIEMIEEEELRNNSRDRRPHSEHDDPANTDFNIDDYVRTEVRDPAPRYIDDVLPSYDSLFVNGNDTAGKNGNESNNTKGDTG